MQNKKILIASWTYYPAWSYGWIARVMYDLSKQLVNDWYNVDAITTDVFDNTSRYNKTSNIVENINIFYFRNISNIIANRFKIPVPIGLLKWLNNNIKNYNIVHIWDFRNIFNLIVYLYCKKNNIPFIVSPFWTVPYKLGLKWIIKKIFDLIWSKNFLKDAKYISVQTQSEFDELINFWINKDKIKLIPLMIDYDKFKDLPEKWLIRKKYNISDNAKILLFVWRIHEYKATDMMLDSFFEYNKFINDSYLIIVWRDDWYEKHLKNRVKELWIEKKVLFVWAIYYPENINYYIDSDIYFMAPSHFEETSTASLEALACWTPVIVTEQASIPFIENYNAWKIIKFNKDEIVRSLLDIKSKDELSCKKLIKEHFDVKAIKNDFLKLYF